MKKLLFIKLLHRYNKIIVKERMTVMDSRILIAPCGMNCMLCQAYQGEGLSCQGCGQNTQRKSCQNCLIYRCPEKERFCFECEKYPCRRLKNLDQRYRQKYQMSMLENLNYIKKYGVEAFIIMQSHQYTCPHCGHLLTVHQRRCLYCGQEKGEVS